MPFADHGQFLKVIHIPGPRHGRVRRHAALGIAYVSLSRRRWGGCPRGLDLTETGCIGARKRCIFPTQKNDRGSNEACKPRVANWLSPKGE
jgi:hypothetical protein